MIKNLFISCYSNSTRTWSAWTVSPGLTWTVLIVPVAPIFYEFFIFIASKTQHSIPSPIVWPTSTETDLTVPGMGAIITLSISNFGFSFMNFLNFTTCWGTKATSKAVPLYLIRKISSKVLLISWTVSVPWSVSILQTLSHCEKPPKEKNQV